MDRSLPRDEPNTDASADRAALVLKGSIGLTCGRSGRPALGPLQQGQIFPFHPLLAPCQPPAGALPAPHRSALTGPAATFFISPRCIFHPVAQRLPYFAMLRGSFALSFESRVPSLRADPRPAETQCVTGSRRISSSCTQQMLL